MSNEWYMGRSGASVGPFSGAQLKELAAAGVLGDTDLVRRGGDGKEVRAGQVRGLFGGGDATERPAVPPWAAPLTTLKGRAASPVPSRGGAVPHWERPVVFAALMLLCFPVGLVLVRRHPAWGAGRKWAYNAAVAAGLFAIAVVVTIDRRADQRAFAEADALWRSGEKAGAVAKYRSLFTRLRTEERVVAYGRVIDFEVERGNTEAAKQLIAEATGHNVAPWIEHPEGERLVAQAEPKRSGSVAPDDHVIVADEPLRTIPESVTQNTLQLSADGTYLVANG